MWFSNVVITLLCFKFGIGARILGIFPTPSISHQVVFRELTHELAKRGHELVVLTTDPARLHPNITEIDTHDISYSLWTTEVINKLIEDEHKGKRALINAYINYYEFALKIFDAHISLPEMQALLRNNIGFDLIMVESIFRPGHVFRHRFKAPVISVSSFGCVSFSFDSVGVSSHPIIFPDLLSEGVNSYTLSKKMYALYLHWSKYYYDFYFVERANDLMKKYFGADTPDLRELESQTDMLFVNVNPIWDGIRPVPPNVIYMWGTHLQPVKDIPRDLKSYLDSSTRGVVYMSLGTNIKLSELPLDRVSVFLETFRRLQYNVLLKWENEELPDKPENVRIEKWLPQADLLRHPNIKVFITQGGIQSLDEALSSGVPLIGIPIYGDQENNAGKIEKHGVGIRLDINTLTVDKLEDAVNAVAQTDKYRAAVQRMSRLLADSVDGAAGVSRAANYAEYVIRHGGASHLRSPAVGVSFYEYYMLDVAAVLALALTVLVLVLVTAIRFLYNQLRLRIFKNYIKNHVD